VRWMLLLLVPAAAACEREEYPGSGELVTFSRRADRVGDRYEVELRSSRTDVRGEDGSVSNDSLGATMRYTDEVLAVEDGRATRVLRSFGQGEGDRTELDPRAGRGSAPGLRTDHFRQFERLVPSAVRVGQRWVEDGALGGPPSDVLGISPAAWLASRCACTLRRLDLNGRREAVIDVAIEFDGEGRSRLDGSIRFDLDAGLLREVDLSGRANGRSCELHGTQTVTPAAGAAK